MEQDNNELIEEVKAFDDGFAEGVFVVPSLTKVKVRALEEYCQKKGVSIDLLDEQEILEFVEKVEGEYE